MIYILIGPDGSGKSTALKHLQNNLTKEGFLFGKGRPLKKDSLEEELAQFEHLLNSGRNIVFDRFPFIDDLVYSKLLSGEESVVFKALDRVKTLLKKATIVYMDAPEKTLKSRILKRGDEQIKPGDIGFIKQQYGRAFNVLEISPIRVNTFGDLNKTLNKILKITTGKYKLSKGIIHIPPIKHVSDTSFLEKHMCLAQHVLKNKEYSDFYAQQRALGKEVMLDNGAAEGEQINIRELVWAFEQVNPTEIVLLDSMGNSRETVVKSSYSMKFFLDEIKEPVDFVGVAHGEDWEKFKWCVDELINIGVDVVGVPKLLTKQFGVGTRKKAVEYITKHHPGVRVHLLGSNEPLTEVINIMKEYPQVTGCDTGLVYLLSEKGAGVDLNSERPEGGIDLKNGFSENYKENIDNINKIIEKELKI